MPTGRTRWKTVDEYIAAAPRGYREKLAEARKVILEAAPEAEERIGYGMPFYSWKGRLAWLALHTNHMSLYVRPPVIQNHAADLAGYTTTKSAVHIPLDKAVPRGLIKKLVKSAMIENELSDRRVPK